MTSSLDELADLRAEVVAAGDSVRAAAAAAEPLDVLRSITVAIERLTATQHELVNVLLDRGATWSAVGEALATSSAAAERRFPRRGRGSDAEP